MSEIKGNDTGKCSNCKYFIIGVPLDRVLPQFPDGCVQNYTDKFLEAFQSYYSKVKELVSKSNLHVKQSSYLETLSPELRNKIIDEVSKPIDSTEDAENALMDWGTVSELGIFWMQFFGSLEPVRRDLEERGTIVERNRPDSLMPYKVIKCEHKSIKKSKEEKE